MATLRSVTIKPAGQGGNYTSINLAEAGEDDTGDLVSRDETILFQPSGDWSGGADTATVILNGWTTDATHRIEIETDAGNASTHWDALKYILNPSGNAITIAEENVGITSVQINSTGGYGLYVSSVTAQLDIQFERVLVKGNSGTNKHGIYITGSVAANSTVKVRNSIIYSCSGTGCAGVIHGSSNTTLEVDNCTISGNTYGLYQTAGTFTARNNIVTGSGNTNTYVGTFTNSDYNSTDSTDTGDGGANSLRSQTFTFIDPTNGDFHLAVGDTGARGNGANLSSDFTTDIDGDTRPAVGAWDIGADQYVASGTAYTRSFTDALAPSESIASVSSFVRSIADAAALGDSRSASAAFARAFADPASLGESQGRVAGFVRSTSDAAALGESRSDTAQFVRSYSDPATLGEARQTIAGFIRTVADPAALGESVSAEISTAQAYTRSFADALALADQVVATIGISYLPLGQPHLGTGLLIEMPATGLAIAAGQTDLTMEFPA